MAHDELWLALIVTRKYDAGLGWACGFLECSDNYVVLLLCNFFHFAHSLSCSLLRSVVLRYSESKVNVPEVKPHVRSLESCMNNQSLFRFIRLCEMVACRDQHRRVNVLRKISSPRLFINATAARRISHVSSVSLLKSVPKVPHPHTMDPLAVSGRDLATTQNFKTIKVDALGTKLSYLDSGSPVGTAYETIFIVHGIIFTNGMQRVRLLSYTYILTSGVATFQKVLKLAPTSGLRIVAINRRDYPHSSPFSPAELDTMATGSDTDKVIFLSNRGLEIMTFIDEFIQQYELPPISGDGKTGGVALAGWSLGNLVTCAAISSAERLSPDCKFRLAKYLRALVLQGTWYKDGCSSSSIFLSDPPTVALGLPARPTWFPLYDPQIPARERVDYTCQWLTSYFKHGALETRSPDALSAYLGSTHRAPSIFNMHNNLSEILYPPPVTDGSDGYLMRNFESQLLANYRKACFDPAPRVLLPKMKIWELSFDATLPNCILALWGIQDDNTAHGGDLVNFEVVHGANHFVSVFLPFFDVANPALNRCIGMTPLK
jgi:hypothetical protein